MKMPVRLTALMALTAFLGACNLTAKDRLMDPNQRATPLGAQTVAVETASGGGLKMLSSGKVTLYEGQRKADRSYAFRRDGTGLTRNVAFYPVGADPRPRG